MTPDQKLRIVLVLSVLAWSAFCFMLGYLKRKASSFDEGFTEGRRFERERGGRS